MSLHVISRLGFSCILTQRMGGLCTPTHKPPIRCVIIQHKSSESTLNLIVEFIFGDFLGVLSKLESMIGDVFTGQVRRHNKYCVLTFDGCPMAIR